MPTSFRCNHFGSLAWIALLAMVLQTSAAQTSNPVRLERLWTATLGPAYTQAAFRLAVCPDGSTYLSDARERIARLDSTGQVQSDTKGHDLIQAALALACDSARRLVSINRDRLVVWTQQAGSMAVASSIDVAPLKLSPSRLVVTGNGYFVLGARRDGSGEHYVHRLSPQGELIQSFANAPCLEPAVARQTALKGSIAWDSNRQRIAFIPLAPLAASLFDENGTTVQTGPVFTDSPRAVRIDSERGTLAGGDRVMYAVYLRGGHIAVQTIEAAAASGGNTHDAFFLRILDGNTLTSLNCLQLTGVVGGFLQGATASDVLYFASITPQKGIQVIAARLQFGSPK